MINDSDFKKIRKEIIRMNNDAYRNKCDSYKSIGKICGSTRQASGLVLNDIARFIHLTPMTISKIERGEYVNNAWEYYRQYYRLALALQNINSRKRKGKGAKNDNI